MSLWDKLYLLTNTIHNKLLKCPHHVCAYNYIIVCITTLFCVINHLLSICIPLMNAALSVHIFCCTLMYYCTEENNGQWCPSWIFTFWNFSAAPLSRAAISTKIKDPNGAGPGGDERCRDGTLLWISNAAHVSEVMTDSQAPFTGFPAKGSGDKGPPFLVTK